MEAHRHLSGPPADLRAVVERARREVVPYHIEVVSILVPGPYHRVAPTREAKPLSVDSVCGHRREADAVAEQTDRAVRGLAQQPRVACLLAGSPRPLVASGVSASSSGSSSSGCRRNASPFVAARGCTTVAPYRWQTRGWVARRAHSMISSSRGCPLTARTWCPMVALAIASDVQRNTGFH